MTGGTLKTRSRAKPVGRSRGRARDAALWVVAIEVPKSAGAAFIDAFGAISDTLTCFECGPDEGSWRFEAFVEGAAPSATHLNGILARAADEAGIGPPRLRITPLPNKDWLAENRKQFPPVAAGRFFVYGSYFEGMVPRGHVSVVLDAGLAFGSGTHESTRGCLLALDRLARRRRFRRPLDLGTGSGILAIAMAKTWRVPVAAADIDPVAVAVAAANARRNGVAPWVRPVTSDGLAVHDLGGWARYDLIVANILARPLERLAPRLARALMPGGAMVLSGILNEQAAGVLAAFRAQGVALERPIALGRWVTLILRRRAGFRI